VKRKKSSAHSTRPGIPHYYPAYIDLAGKKAVVVGGGSVAERKILSLLKAHAHVKVISPYLTKRLEREKEKGKMHHVNRHYKKGDLKSAFLVIAATNSLKINEQVSHDAPYLVNVVDMPDLCNFIVPSLVQRGPLKVAISTSGVSPAFSRSVRKELETFYGPEFLEYLHLLKIIRKKAMGAIRDKKKRSDFLKAIASEKIIEMIRNKGLRWTKKHVNELSRKAVKTNLQ
jgi:precorrin-2 dehydrogenase/sirohydrochlorin ferrochelatase